jgi:hypothetical protein
VGRFQDTACGAARGGFLLGGMEVRRGRVKKTASA